MKDIDGNDLKSGTTLGADICIIGGGAAGIAIAKSFSGAKDKILLLESGDYSYDDDTQALYDFESVGHSLRAQQGYISRNRYLGGSTNTWHGGCAPLDPIDFEARDWMPDSGWPITRDDLDTYYREAADLLRLPGYELFKNTAWSKYVLDYKPGFLNGDELNPAIFLFANRPINMKIAYAKHLQASSNVQIILNANVTEIESNDTQREVRQIHVSTLHGNKYFVKAKRYVLCCGGWENARLLLVSKRYSSTGLGNDFDVVGRYYAEHPKISSGKIIPASKTLRSPIMIWKRRVNKRGYLRLSIKLTESMQRRHKIANHYVQLKYPQSMSEAITSSETFFRGLRLSRSTIHNMVKLAPHVFRLADAFERMIFNLPLKFNHVSLFNHFEQMPNRESRVQLSTERDALGMNRLQVALRISSADKSHMVRFHEILGKAISDQGLGTLVSEFPDSKSDWPGLTDSSHHIGTTRMNLDPKKGVVDQNCMVHGISNLYIASSSVFSTSGHVNPTFTIVAIALKLAAHLKEQRLT